MGDLKALLAPAWVHTALGGVALLAVAWLVAWLVRHVLVRVMTTVSRRTAWHWDDALLKRGVFRRLAQVSLAEQEELERTQTGDFGQFVAAYQAGLLGNGPSA